MAVLRYLVRHGHKCVAVHASFAACPAPPLLSDDLESVQRINVERRAGASLVETLAVSPSQRVAFGIGADHPSYASLCSVPGAFFPFVEEGGMMEEELRGLVWNSRDDEWDMEKIERLVFCPIVEGGEGEGAKGGEGEGAKGEGDGEGAKGARWIEGRCDRPSCVPCHEFAPALLAHITDGCVQ